MRPRPYLSRYQLILWEQSPPRYMEEYWGDARKFKNNGMVLGSEIADAMKSGEETGDLGKDLVLAQMPRYALRDQEQIVQLKVGKEIIPILIKPDSMTEDWGIIAEAKTGSELKPWTQKKVDADPQLTWYCMGVFLEKKIIPALELYYAPTRLETDDYGNEMPVLTGEVIKFTSTRRMSDIMNMMMRARKAWKEIDEAGNAMIA